MAVSPKEEINPAFCGVKPPKNGRINAVAVIRKLCAMLLKTVKQPFENRKTTYFY